MEGVARFLEEFAVRALLPHLEVRVRNLNHQVSAAKQAVCEAQLLPTHRLSLNTAVQSTLYCSLNDPERLGVNFSLSSFLTAHAHSLKQLHTAQHRWRCLAFA